MNGTWQNAGKVEWQLTVPLPDGSDGAINQLELPKAAETLGMWLSPSDRDDEQLEKIFNRCEKWTM